MLLEQFFIPIYGEYQLSTLVEAPVREKEQKAARFEAKRTSASSKEILARRDRIIADAVRVQSGNARGTDITDLSESELYARFFGK